MKLNVALALCIVSFLSSVLVSKMRIGSPTVTKSYSARVDDIFNNPLEYLPKDDDSKQPLALPKQILLFGDSLLELSSDPRLGFSFSAAVTHAFRRRADVVNRALSGYTSRWLSATPIQRIAKELHEAKQELFMAVLLLGTNDSVLPGFPHHVSVEEFGENLKAIVNTISESIKPRESSRKPLILLVTPPPCSLKQLNSPESKLSASGRARSNDAVEQYVAKMKQVVDSKYASDGPAHVRIIDLYSAFSQLARNSSTPMEHFLSDGVHLNGEGYKVLYAEIMEYIKELTDELLPVPMIEPHFSKLIN